MEYLMTYSWAILAIMVILAVLFYLGILNPKSAITPRCTFPPGSGFSCVTFKLNSSIDRVNPPYPSNPYVNPNRVGEGNLRLEIGQATGHTITITSITCTQNTTYLPPTWGGMFIWCKYNPASHLWEWSGCPSNITISSASKAVVAGKIRNKVGAAVWCLNEKFPGPGWPDIIPTPAQRAFGNIYVGKIYIRYTELDTRVQRVVVGDLIAKYEI